MEQSTLNQKKHWYKLNDLKWKENFIMSNSKSIYQMITNRFIEELEQGVIPWNRPWHGVRSGAYNRISKKSYSLLNQMMLKHQGEYATFNQWKSLGGTIKKGSKSEIVVFWKVLPVEEEQEDGTKIVKQIPLLKYINVFHISQVDGVEPLEIAELNNIDPIEEAEKIKEDYKSRENIDIQEIITNKAFYSPARDQIQVPCKEQYTNIEEFYSTLFHEMIHSTGHKDRLNRIDSSANSYFGSKSYSKEELVAEIGAASILNMLGIETKNTFKNSASYIQSWLKVLKNDVKFIVSATSKAQKAVDYVLNNINEGEVEG